MFATENYPSFLGGVLTLGGLGVLPLLYGAGLGIDYGSALPWSLASCAVFLIGFRKNGTVSWVRAIPGMAVLAVAATSYTISTGKPSFGAGGAFGFLLLLVCGYAGIAVNRVLGGTEDRRRPHPIRSTETTPVSFHCWQCKAEMSIDASSRGTQLRCSACGTKQTAP
jgi:hypothetical protein